MVEKHELDKYIAQKIVNSIRAGPRYIILVMMLTTSILSMWITNTASTALMIPLVIKLSQGTSEEEGNFAKICVLSIAYSATAGGLGTLLGTSTPPMATSLIDKITGYQISFLEWIFYGFPVTISMVFIIWYTLFRIFPTNVRELAYKAEEQSTLDTEQKLGIIVFLISVALWVTGKIPAPIARLIGWSGHGMSTAMVAGIIAVLLFLTGLLDKDDISDARWSTILLIGGSLSLGSSMAISGLNATISEALVPITQGLSKTLVLFIVGFFGLGVSIIASNTASAGIILPIAIGLGEQTGLSPIVLGILVGVTTSLDFMLPVGTPPNAIAYSSDKVDMSDMIKAGILLDISGIIIAVLLARFVWPYIIG
jgi:sodium-dependent dicarboxylate transporter 2/3/5